MICVPVNFPQTWSSPIPAFLSLFPSFYFLAYFPFISLPLFSLFVTLSLPYNQNPTGGVRALSSCQQGSEELWPWDVNACLCTLGSEIVADKFLCHFIRIASVRLNAFHYCWHFTLLCEGMFWIQALKVVWSRPKIRLEISFAGDGNHVMASICSEFWGPRIPRRQVMKTVHARSLKILGSSYCCHKIIPGASGPLWLKVLWWMDAAVCLQFL